MWLKNWRYKLLCFCVPCIFISWGFSAHKDLHTVAISGLPIEVWSCFKKHEKQIIEYSVLADKRKHTDSTESFNHYLDLDLDSIKFNGRLPDAISEKYNLLSYLFYNYSSDSTNCDYLIKVAADLGHYIGDAHVPLHTTKNYNGKLTGQIGIHALWETHVYELTRDSRIPQKIEAIYISDIKEYSDSIILNSHSMVEFVLEKEIEIRLKDGTPQKWGYRTRGRTLDLIPTPGFCREYSDSIDGMVQKRFYQSANAI